MREYLGDLLAKEMQHSRNFCTAPRLRIRSVLPPPPLPIIVALLIISGCIAWQVEITVHFFQAFMCALVLAYVWVLSHPFCLVSFAVKKHNHLF